MKKTLYVLSLLVVVSMLLTACGAPAATPTAAPAAPRLRLLPLRRNRQWPRRPRSRCLW